MRHTISSFSFDIPEEWCDLTPEDDESYPFTMALEGGVGVIQVSLAEYASGPVPQIDQNRLAEMFSTYCDAQGFTIEPDHFDNGDVLGVGGTHVTPTEIIAAWYVSGGGNFALVSYVSQFPDEPGSEAELSVAKRLVATARFNV